MSFSDEKKEQIKHYLLEKLREGQSSAVKRTAEAFGVTPSTVYKYLDALENAGTVQKLKRGEYRLTSKESVFVLHRSAGEIISEGSIYERYIWPFLQELPRNVQGIWDYLCGEMLNNVIDHSEAETLEITVITDALQTTVRLTDDGVGIFKKISAYFGLESIDDAIGELFKGKLTTDAKHHSGEGIFFSSRLADTFMIFSSGRVFTHNRFAGDSLQNAAARAFYEEINSDKGTTVFMTLANDSKKRAKDIFDLYADVDGGFTKTRIPLKAYFESAPVSRSQAKRLLTGLDRFREVELDFDGLEWMGQGFAHELFAVFADSHPEIRLLPLNMNDDVRRMYTHVTAQT